MRVIPGCGHVPFLEDIEAIQSIPDFISEAS
jgi:hypothetical protein